MKKEAWRFLDTPEFSPEQEAAYGLLTRAMHDIMAEFELPDATVDAILMLLDRLVREALGRGRPNRLQTYLDQWGAFLARTHGRLRSMEKDKRAAYLRECVRDFRLIDARGRKQSTQPDWNERANVIAEKDGQKWQAYAPPAALDPKPLIELTDLDTNPLPSQKLRAQAPSLVQNEREVPWPPIDISRAQPLKPMNTPALLLQEYKRIYEELKGVSDQDLRRPEVRTKVFVGVPLFWVSRWFEGHIRRSDLSLLAAAYHVQLPPSVDNLSNLREVLAGARQVNRLAEEKVKAQKKVLIVEKK